ncbi:MAG TPA: hypothetical protein PLF30_00485 [Candidatus Moranbacteria bacterium]|jgi:hypothetical protein|nr:hypothetical protein [Candidatus Moranbacteria bacterium]HPX94030.1 hypothetical protein [Candidatus Moranbacteria bacterium]HQB59243.1 hypothetical protein [Candidatus Moranbacteria bacterium]
MIYSKFEKVVKEKISDEDVLGKIGNKLHDIEREIDGMANRNDADLNEILRRTKELLERAFRNSLGSSIWVGKNWKDIKEDIEHNLRELKNRL